MFGFKQQGMVIAKELNIVGSVTAEGLVWVYGQIDGNLSCNSLVIERGSHVGGTVAAERVVVDGKVFGPIRGGEIVLKSQAQVVGDLHCQSLAIESGAFFHGRLRRIRGNGQTAVNLEGKSVSKAENREGPSGRIERAVAVEAEQVSPTGQPKSLASEVSSKSGLHPPEWPDDPLPENAA